MKKTLSTYEIATLLHSDENAGFSYAGARALAEHLEQLEQDTGEEMEFDRVAIRCDFAEHSSLEAWAEDYFSNWQFDLGVEPEDDADTVADIIRKHIQENGTLIEFAGGIIVSAF